MEGLGVKGAGGRGRGGRLADKVVQSYLALGVWTGVDFHQPPLPLRPPVLKSKTIATIKPNVLQQPRVPRQAQAHSSRQECIKEGGSSNALHLESLA